MLTNTDNAVIEDFYDCCEAMGFKIREYPARNAYRLSGGPNPPLVWLREQGLAGCSALTKRIPSWVFGLPERQKWLFVEALMVTDGWFGKDAGQGGVTLANEALIDDINVLFMHLGIIATKSPKRENGFAGAWSLYFGGDGIQTLLDNCDLKQKRFAAETIMEKRRYSLVDTYPDAIKSHRGQGTEWYRDQGLRIDNHYDLTRGKLRKMMTLEPEVEEWQRLESAEVFWDQIVLIEDAGEVDTYDVQVEKNENLITNGLVTHNSTLLTFLLPMYCAVFRVKRFILILSDSDDQVRTFCAKLKREIEENERLRADFGEMCGLRYGLRWTGEDFTIAHAEADARGVRRVVFESVIAGRSIHSRLRALS